MTRFYRFISSDELHTILANSFTNDMIASEDAAMMHLFKKKHQRLSLIKSIIMHLT